MRAATVFGNSSIYNPSNLASSNVNISVSTGGGENMNEYLKKTGDVITGPIQFDNGSTLIFPNGTQERAYTNANDGSISTVLDKTYFMTSTETDTRFSNNVSIDDNLNVGGILTFSNLLPISKITNLSTTLTGFDTRIVSNRQTIDVHSEDISLIQTTLSEQTTINDTVDSSINTIQSTLSTQVPIISSHTTTLQSHSDTIDEHSSQIVGMNSHLDSLDTSISSINDSIVDHTSLLSNHAQHLDTIDTHLSQIDNSIATLNATNDFPTVLSHLSDLDDLTQSHTTTIQQLVAYDETQTTMNNTMNDDITDLLSFKTDQLVLNSAIDVQQSITNSQLDNISNLLQGKQPLLSSNNRLNINYVDGNIQSQLDTLTTAVSNLTQVDTLDLERVTEIIGDVANLTTNVQGLTNTVSMLNQSDDAIWSALQPVIDEQVTMNTSITDIQSSILLKQDILSTENKLSATLIDLSESNLRHFDITNSLNDRLTNSETQITTMSNVNIIQSNLITDLSSQLQLKQDIIDSNHLLDQSLIRYDETHTLDEYLEIQNTQLNLKQNAITTESKLALNLVSNLSETLTDLDNRISTLSTLQDGDVVSFENIGSNMDALETMINSKQDILNNSTNTLPISHVSGLQTAIDNINSSISLITGVDTQQLADIQSINTQLTQLQTDTTTNTTDISTINQNISDLQSDILAKQDSITSSSKLSSSLVDFTGTNIEYLQGLSQSISTSLTSINSSINTLSLSDIMANNSINNLTTQINNKANQSDLQTLSDTVTSHSSDLTSIQSTISSIETNMTNLSSDLSSLSSLPNNVSQLSSDVINIQSDVTNVLSDVSQLTNDVSTIQTTVTNVETNISSIENNVTALTGDISQLNTDVLTIQTTVATHTSDISSIETDTVALGSSIQTINTSITSLNNNVTGVNTQITSIQTNIDVLNSADIIHDSQILAIQSDITTVENDLATINDTINDIQSELGFTNSNVTNIQTDISSLQSDMLTKQSTINDSTNKLPISHIDTLSSTLTSLQNQLNSVTNLNNDQTADLVSLNSAIDTISADLLLKQDIISNINQIAISNVNNLQSSLTTLQTNIDNISLSGGGVPSISYDSNSLQTRIINHLVVDNISFYGEEATQTSAFTSSKNSDIIDCKLKATNLSYDPNLDTTEITGNVIINNLQSSQLNEKQDILSITNKLDPQLINSTGGSLTSQSIEFLSSIASDLQTQLDNLSSLITALQNSDSSQINTNTTLSNDISSLQTSKQNVINSSNRLNTSLCEHGSGATILLSTQINNMVNSIDAKANIDSPSFTGTVSGITKNMIGLGNVENTSDASKQISTATQNALNLKSNINDPVFTTKITTPALRLTTSPAAGHVLTSNATGDATWSAPVGASSSVTRVEGTIAGSYGASTQGRWARLGNISLDAGKWLIYLNATFNPVTNTTIMDTRVAIFASGTSFDSSAAGTTSAGVTGTTGIFPIQTRKFTIYSTYFASICLDVLVQPSTNNTSYVLGVQNNSTNTVTLMSDQTFYAIRIA